MAINQYAHDPANYLVGGVTVLIKEDGGTNYKDLGNVTNFQFSTDKDTLKHYTARSGRRILDREIVTREELSMTFNVEELNSIEILKKVLNGGAISNNTQGSVTLRSNVLTVEKGLWQKLDRKKVSNVVVSKNSVTVAATNYEIDADLGLIRVKPSSSLTDGDTIEVEFDAEAMTTDESQVFSPLGNTAGTITLDCVIVKVKDNEGNFHYFESDSATLTSSGPLSINDTDWSNVAFSISVYGTATSTYTVTKTS